MRPRPSNFRCVAFLLGCAWTSGCSDPVCPPVPSATTSSATARPSGSAPLATDPQTAEPSLVFRAAGREDKTLKLGAILAAIPPETVKQLDPYYNREKTYKAVPLAALIQLGFSGVDGLPTREYVFKALDGYTVPLTGSKVFEAGAYVAYEDTEKSGWEPIGQQKANPGPFYLVWAGKAQTDLETHPRPYQLATLEIARFEDVFPFTVPKGLAETEPAWKGFAVFREQCIHCHAINRQGGRVGPDLNVPQSVVEYRPVDQIKAYIKNPRTFRYSTMPAHESLGAAELDAIVAYFTAMKDRKHDDEAGH
ncbi:MAG: cytochrome c [Polyangiaceae bacterium]